MYNLYIYRIYFLKPDRHSVSPDRANVREEKANDTLQCQKCTVCRFQLNDFLFGVLKPWI